MSEKTQIILLAVTLIIIGIEIFIIFNRLDQLESNQEIMRKYINQKFKELKTNDNKNTSSMQEQKK